MEGSIIEAQRQQNLRRSELLGKVFRIVIVAGKAGQIGYRCYRSKVMKLKCGRCGRGNITVELGYKCRVCGAEGIQII